MGSPAARIARWRYERSYEGPSRRDLRIDLLRGFCIFAMIVDHIGGETSWLYLITGGDRFVVSAAEGFVFVSGLAMGMVHERVIERRGLRAMFGKVLERAWFLYLITVALTIAFAAVSTVLGTPWAGQATPATSRTDFAVAVITLHRAYSLTDVLLLYVLLVLSAAPALWLVRNGHTVLLLAASWSVWAARQVWPDRVPVIWQVIDGGFPFTAWQVMFFTGLVIGYHRYRIALYLKPSRLVVAGLATTAVLLVAEAFMWNADALHLEGGTAALHEILFDKNEARIGRVIALFATASFFYAAITVAWVPIRRASGWLLIPFGQRALYAYAVQLFVVALLSSAPLAPVRLDRENALFQGAGVLLVWVACLAEPSLGRFVRDALARLRPTESRASAG